MSTVAVLATGLAMIYRSDDQDVVALSAVDLTVPAGQTLALLGPSGAGKSTLLRLLAGLQRASGGSLQVADARLAPVGRDTDAQATRMRAGQVGLVMQGAASNLLDHLSPLANVRFAQQYARRAGRDVPDAHDVLAVAGVGRRAHTPLRELTTGQRQRVALAAGLAAGPSVLLADEPTSRLDQHARDEVVDALVAANREWDTTIVVVTHDAEVAARFGRTVTIRDGRIGAEGRDGVEYAVVAGDGSLQLPPDVRAALPAGTLLEVTHDDAGVHLRRADHGEDT